MEDFDETQALSIPEAAQPQAEDGGITIRFNHEERRLSPEEAVSLAQKGLKYESITPMLDQLAYLALMEGKTPKQAVIDYIKQAEKKYEGLIRQQVGDNDEVVSMLMEKYKRDNGISFLQAEERANRDLIHAEEKRLGEEFLRLKEEFPQIDKPEKIPDAVLRLRKDGDDLFTAYLKYQHGENKKAEQERSRQIRNKKASLGAMAPGSESTDPLFLAFIKGLKR